MPTVSCLRCGTQFHAKPARPRKFCSPACYHATQHQPPLRLICDHCGKEYERPAAWVRKNPSHKHYCSNSCTSASRRGEDRGGNRHRPASWFRREVIARDRTCVACGLWDARPRCMQVHHLGDDETSTDLAHAILLCIRCHREWHRQTASGPSMRSRPRKIKR